MSLLCDSDSPGYRKGVQCVKRCPADAIWMTTEKELTEKDKDGSMMAFYEQQKEELYDKEESL